jgi:tagatose-6-phosphate ketose/aldose isomerase
MSNPNSLAATPDPVSADWTSREIHQQPAAWAETRAVLKAMEPATRPFLAPLLALRDLRIILTGAGSSAYLGRCLAPALGAALGLRVEAIATTDLVAGPGLYFQRGIPTLLVSFARSGNSPESLAAVELAERHLDSCHQIVITCNADGALGRRGSGQDRTLTILLPDLTHDRGFAMTSSFSSMLLAAWSLLAPSAFTDNACARLGQAGRAALDAAPALVGSLVERRFQRTVYLGSCGLQGLASEAALKLLELTDGGVAALSESTLGFRHGPKTFVTPDCLVVIFLSSDRLTRRYDLDLARELAADGIAGRVLVLSGTVQDLAGLDAWVVPGMTEASDAELAFPYLVVAQLYAYGMSLALGCTPDNPSASGVVSRVVKGVTIHQAED